MTLESIASRAVIHTSVPAPLLPPLLPSPLPGPHKHTLDMTGRPAQCGPARSNRHRPRREVSPGSPRAKRRPGNGRFRAGPNSVGPGTAPELKVCDRGRRRIWRKTTQASDVSGRFPTECGFGVPVQNVTPPPHSFLTLIATAGTISRCRSGRRDRHGGGGLERGQNGSSGR